MSDELRQAWDDMIEQLQAARDAIDSPELMAESLREVIKTKHVPLKIARALGLYDEALDPQYKKTGTLPEQVEIAASFADDGYLWEVSSAQSEVSVSMIPVEQVEESPGAFRVDFAFVIEDAQGRREVNCSAWPGEPSQVVWG